MVKNRNQATLRVKRAELKVLDQEFSRKLGQTQMFQAIKLLKSQFMLIILGNSLFLSKTLQKATVVVVPVKKAKVDLQNLGHKAKE